MEKYWYCGVVINGCRTVYSYISDMGEIPVSSFVEVPFGSENTLRIGSVQSCAEYTADTAPYPVEKTKHITRLATAEEYELQVSPPSYRPYWDDLDFVDDIDIYIEEEDWDEVLNWAIDHHESDDPDTIRKVIECYTLCVEQNMPVAALNLGTFYYLGRGVDQDYKKAYELYKLAADAGELRAICNCGYCFYYGRHQAVDYAEAFRFFSLGALLYNDANCLYKLGDQYLNGYGVEKNEAYAFQLYQRALERCAEEDEDRWGDTILPDAQFRVGKCLLRAIGTEKNAETAHRLLCLALVGFYTRRKTDPFVVDLIQNTKELIAEAQVLLDEETLR